MFKYSACSLTKKCNFLFVGLVVFMSDRLRLFPIYLRSDSMSFGCIKIDIAVGLWAELLMWFSYYIHPSMICKKVFCLTWGSNPGRPKHESSTLPWTSALTLNYIFKFRLMNWRIKLDNKSYLLITSIELSTRRCCSVEANLQDRRYLLAILAPFCFYEQNMRCLSIRILASCQSW